MRIGFLSALVLVLGLLAAAACAREPVPTPVPASEIAALVRQAVSAAVPQQPAPLSPQDMQQLVEQAVAESVPAGASAADIQRMVQAAVAAGPGVSKEDLQAAIAAQAGQQMTAADVKKVVNAALAAMPAPKIDATELRPLVERAVAAAVPEGATTAEIRSMVEAAVAKAVAAAGAAGPSPLTATQVESIVAEAIKELPAPEPVVVQVLVTPTPVPPPPTRVPQPVVWRIGMPDDITTTNIWDIMGPGSTAYNFYALLNRYPFLYGLSDQRFDWVPSWADGFPTEFVQEGDLFTSTIKVRSGATWSDGVPITADDFAFTFNTAVDLKLPGNWASVVDPNVVDHAEALDASTLKLYLKSVPGLARWQYGVTGAPAVAKHFWEPLVQQAIGSSTDVDAQVAALFAIVPENEPTAGEMLLTKWEEGAFVEVKANDQYFFKDSTVTEYADGAYAESGPNYTSGPFYGEASGDVALEFTRGPYAESVIFSPYPSQDTLVLALQAGEVDYMLTPLGLQRGFQDQLAGRSDISIITNAPNGIRYLGFNTRRPPQDIKEFRQAVSILIDKEFVTGTVLQGVADPAYTMVPPGNGFWYNPDVAQLGKGLSREERINEVVALLKGVGFTWDVEPAWDPASTGAVNPEGQGLRMPNGELVPEMTILAPSAGYDPLRATYAVWIERWLREAGIPVTAQLKGFNVIVPKVFDEQDFDMWILGWGLTIFPDYLNDFFNSARAGLEDLNAGGYSNPEFDRLGNELVAETDIAAAKEEAFRLQEILADELPYVVLLTTQILEPVRSNVHFPFTEWLDGIQNYFQSANGPLAFTQFE